MNSPCSNANAVSPSLFRTVNSIDASFSVPTVARQPLLSRVDASASAFLKRDRQVFAVLDLGAVDGERGVETESHFWHELCFPSVGMALLHAVTPELGQPASIRIKSRPHEWSLGISPRLCNPIDVGSLLQSVARLDSLELRSASLMRANLAALPSVLDADWSMFANSEPMSFQLPPVLGNPAKLVQIPKSSCDLVDRPNDNVGFRSVRPRSESNA